MLIEYVQEFIESPITSDINDIIKGISSREQLVDGQSNFIRAAIVGDFRKLQGYIQKINSFFQMRQLMIENAEKIFQRAVDFSVEKIPELVKTGEGPGQL